ncbi:MAG: hypothetical protein C5B54_08010 [Acidobacteria bacterium]|nr:MAG: hypothetical protein C5B54_08010 [Acidobacteriota bacterium]
MTPEDLLEILYIAANAQTPEEKARVAWRASDYLWWHYPRWPAGFCRRINDLCPEKPFVKNLWTKEEREKHMGEMYAFVQRVQAEKGKPTS